MIDNMAGDTTGELPDLSGLDGSQLVLHTTASVEQLRERGDYLSGLLSAVGHSLTAAGERWRETPDSEEETKDRLWAEFMTIEREYQVLSSWTNLFRAAYVFSTVGADCVALDGISTD